jgi:hypothetical protein
MENDARAPEMLEKRILVPVEEKSNSGKPISFIRLSDETRLILNQFMPFLAEDQCNYKEMGKEFEEKLVELLSDVETRDLAANEIQRISRQYKLLPGSDFLERIVQIALNQDIRNVRHPILYAIRNFVEKFDEDMKEEVKNTLYGKLSKIIELDDNSNGGKRDRNIVLEIFDHLDLMPFRYDDFLNEFFDAIFRRQFQEAQIWAERIIRRFPENISVFRLSLIDKHGSADERERMFIESMLNKTPLY